jgi:hypothetical protein
MKRGKSVLFLVARQVWKLNEIAGQLKQKPDPFPLFNV